MIPRGRFLEYVERLQEARVLVIGPSVAERDVHCSVTRLTPDRPVPVFVRERESIHPGVAALTAATIANLGVRVTLLSVVGRGRPGTAMRELLGALNIALLEPSDRTDVQTSELLRLLSQGRQMLQIRRGWKAQPLPDLRNSLKSINPDGSRTAPFDGICVVDGLPAMLSPEDLETIGLYARACGIPIVFDAAGNDLEPSHPRFDALIVNGHEAHVLVDRLVPDNAISDPVDQVRQLCPALCPTVLLTQGRSGALLGVGDQDDNSTCTLHPVPVPSHALADRRGVGYVLSGVYAALVSIGAGPQDAADLACQAASLTAAQPGPKNLNKEDLLRITYGEIESHVADGIDVFSRIREDHLPTIDRAARLLMEAYHENRQVLVFGNGGSAAEANHLVGELTGRFKENRPGLPSISLNSNDALTTCLANDYGFDDVFARQIDTYCRQGDVVIGLSTSGKSRNVIRGLHRARERGARVIALCGQDGGEMAALADVPICVPSRTTARIQEAHLFVIHVLCDMLDRRLDEQGRLHPSATEI